MISNIPPEITITSFSLLGVLSAYIWDTQSRKISKIEKEIEKCPMVDLKIDVAEIKKDIKWILKNMQE